MRLEIKLKNGEVIVGRVVYRDTFGIFLRVKRERIFIAVDSIESSKTVTSTRKEEL